MPTPFFATLAGSIAYGAGRLDGLGDDVTARAGAGARVLVVGDAGMARLGLVERVREILARSGHAAVTFADLAGEPTDAAIDAAAALARQHGAGLVVGIGGGSALDTAKLAAGIAPADRPALAYGLCAIPLPAKPLRKILVPTTAGTGSETTRTSVFADSTGRKLWAWGDELRADLSLLDPALAVELPRHLTAATGVDALVHAIEAATVKRANPVATAFALEAIRLGAAHLPRAVDRPDDIAARGAMAIAAALAGLAIDIAGTGIAHAIGHALGTIAKVHHGRAVGLCLRAALAWNAEAAPESHAAVARALGVADHGQGNAALAAAGAAAYAALLDRAGLPLSLADHGLGAKDAARLVQISMDAENAPMRDNNARAVGGGDMARLAHAVLAA
ncbi:MAG: iron-containing alcohol dehydrogenase [Alphaproteobacteria bacterium]|nr:iron-containing alcohol dehydrogenase [Alphaproteobacteria bacterium]